MVDPDAWSRLLERIEHSIASPAFGLFVAVMVSGVCIWAIVRIVNTRNETLAAGNRTLEQIQVNMAVSTVRQAEGVEAMHNVAKTIHGFVELIGRLDDRIHDHDRDEQVRHAETLRQIIARQSPERPK